MMILPDHAEVSVLRPSSPIAGMNSALLCLDDTLSGRFHAWHGRSGRRYVASVYQLDHAAPGRDLPDLGEAVLIAVERRESMRAILGLVSIERQSDWSRAIMTFHDLARRKPNEWHVHLLARDRTARAAVVADLGSVRRLAIVA